MLVVFDEYQEETGIWKVAFVKKFKKDMNNFVLPARVMELRLDEYYKYVIDNYEPDEIIYIGNGFISFGWSIKNYSKAHKLLLELNRTARKKQFEI